MDDSGVYAAASEIRDAIRELENTLGSDLPNLISAIDATVVPRRERWASLLYLDLVMRSRLALVWGGTEADQWARNYAQTAWQLADILDAADPWRYAQGEGRDRDATDPEERPTP